MLNFDENRIDFYKVFYKKICTNQKKYGILNTYRKKYVRYFNIRTLYFAAAVNNSVLPCILIHFEEGSIWVQNTILLQRLKPRSISLSRNSARRR